MTGPALWTARQAAEATGGRSTAEWSATGVSIDSRTLEPGDLFVAIEGPSFDGHDFIAQAFQKGAVAAVSHRPGEAAPARGALLLVDDTLDALWALGAAARARSAARFIGVTGSVGKTGTKEALARCLGAQAPTAASAGSLNNHWGLPLSLARMAPAAVYGVFELGMNSPGEIRRLAGLLRPHVALVTTVVAAHLGYFESVEAIAEAKAEIFEGVGPGGVAVLNRDNPHFTRLAERAEAAGLDRVISFGRDPAAEVRLLDCRLEATASQVTAEVLGRRVIYDVALPGSHWVANSLAVLATVLAVGADPERAAAELARLTPIKGRGEWHRVPLAKGAFDLIDDSYNANPSSMAVAFEVLGRIRPGRSGRRVAVLGDMLELGPHAAEAHAALAEPAVAAGIDLVFSCGEAMAALDAALPAARRGGHAANSRALAPLVVAALRDGDAVLVKGSASSRMGLVVEALRALGRDLPRAANDV